MMLDADHFKRVNDTYGHLAGDAVLKELARRIQESLRSYDLTGRYGGEEFLIVLPGCWGDELYLCAERVRAAIAAEPIAAEGTPLTVSVGTAVLDPHRNSEKDALAAADSALYEAKHSGRNCVVSSDLQPNQPSPRPSEPSYNSRPYCPEAIFPCKAFYVITATDAGDDSGTAQIPRILPQHSPTFFPKKELRLTSPYGKITSPSYAIPAPENYFVADNPAPHLLELSSVCPTCRPNPKISSSLLRCGDKLSRRNDPSYSHYRVEHQLRYGSSDNRSYQTAAIDRLTGEPE